MPDTPKCPQCGTPLPAGVLAGLCPACLLKAGAAADTVTEPRQAPFNPPTVAELAVKFPQLEILELIGKGGMGAVYKARQKQLDRIVALKILPPQAAAGPGFAERFMREARALAQLNHPHIVVLYEFGQADGLFYFLMEFVDGINMRQLLNAGHLAPKEALAIVPQICDALEYAHERGIVHRDIKPENILLSRQGQVKIADFGVAKIVSQDPGETAAGAAPAASAELTGAGSAVGTPQYMAPEQLKNSAEVDHRADIYSLGVVFYQMLTGELPAGKIEPPSKKVQIDVRLDEVVLRALEKQPELRYQQASVLKTQVETIAQTPFGSGAPLNTAPFIEAAAARDYSLNINHCLNRAWNLVTSDFWRIVGVSALAWLLITIATSSIVGIVVRYPIIGGLWLYYLQRVRGTPATVETVFSGFKVAFLQLVLLGLVVKVLMLLGFICLIIPGIYLWVAWTFAAALTADQHMDFWPAMELSRKIVNKHWWKFLWFLIVLAAIHFVGFLLCYVGIFVATPLCLAALAYAYEDIFAPAARESGRAPLAASPAPARPASGLTVAAGIALGVALAVVFIAFVGLLAGIAVPNFLAARQRASAMHERAFLEAAPARRARPDNIGQTYFPRGDSIDITSVERTPDRMVVKGHYNLVSTNAATLMLEVASPGNPPPESQQQMQIVKGEGDFTLTDSNIHVGTYPLGTYPCVSMSSASGKHFAEVYFGNQAQAKAEQNLPRWAIEKRE